MASLPEESVLEGELTCPVCLEFFQDPHLLPCGHNFCLPCVKRLKKQAEKGRIKCPECRKTYRYNTPLQKNFRLANIAEDFRKRGQAPSRGSAATSVPIACDYCLGEQAPAVKTCLKCEVSMCGEHLRPHLERPAFREHPLTEPLADLKKRRCPEHDEMFRYYCLEEKRCICNACTIEGHHVGHTIKTLKNTMKDLKASLETALQSTNRKITKNEKTLQEFQNYDRESQSFYEETEQKVSAVGALLKVQLDEFLSSVTQCVRDHSSLLDLEQHHSLSKITKDQARLLEIHTGIEALLKESDPFCFLTEYNSTGKKLKKLLKKPLFVLERESVDAEGMAGCMEAKLEEFMSQFKQQVSEVIDSIDAERHGQGEGREESDDDDDDDDNNEDEEEEDDDDDEEEEDEMSHEEEEEDEHSVASDDLFFLNTDEEGEENEEEEEHDI